MKISVMNKTMLGILTTTLLISCAEIGGVDRSNDYRIFPKAGTPIKVYENDKTLLTNRLPKPKLGSYADPSDTSYNLTVKQRKNTYQIKKKEAQKNLNRITNEYNDAKTKKNKAIQDKARRKKKVLKTLKTELEKQTKKYANNPKKLRAIKEDYALKIKVAKFEIKQASKAVKEIEKVTKPKTRK